MKHARRVTVLVGVLIASACSILNQPINPDSQSSQTGGARAWGGNSGTGGVVGTGRLSSAGTAGGTGGSEATQECSIELTLFSGSCPTRGLMVPCLSRDADCVLDDCYAWEKACSECLFGPCCAQYATWHQVYMACSQIVGCDSYGVTWDAWRQCGLSNCTTVCNN